MECERSAAEIPVVTPSSASMDSVNAVPKREVFCDDISGRLQRIAALGGEGETDQAAAVGGHEVDGFGRDQLGGHGQVAFVFAILVVDDHQHFAGAEIVEGFRDGGKGHFPQG